MLLDDWENAIFCVLPKAKSNHHLLFLTLNNGSLPPKPHFKFHAMGSNHPG